MSDQSRPATGYPAPPPQAQAQTQPPSYNQNYYYPNHNPYNYNNYNSSTYGGGGGGINSSPSLFRRFFGALIAVFIILGVILLIVWLVLRPRIPNFTLTSLSLSSLNISSSPPHPQISGTWSLHFSVSNPNTKLHVYYDDLEARLFYRHAFISLNQLPPFDQPTKSQSSLDALIVASDAYIDPDLVNSFNRDRSKGTVNFDLRLVAIVRFKAGGWRARRRFLRVFCDDLTLAFSSSSSNKANFTNGSTRCDVGI